jgi:hypothetical protein
MPAHHTLFPVLSTWSGQKDRCEWRLVGTKGELHLLTIDPQNAHQSRATLKPVNFLRGLSEFLQARKVSLMKKITMNAFFTYTFDFESLDAMMPPLGSWCL